MIPGCLDSEIEFFPLDGEALYENKLSSRLPVDRFSSENSGIPVDGRPRCNFILLQVAIVAGWSQMVADGLVPGHVSFSVLGKKLGEFSIGATMVPGLSPN